MNRRTLIGAAAAVAAFPVLNRVASAQTSLKTKNVVFVHGLFADGSCWSKVIARLQQKGINCTSVQNPLTSLHEASEVAQRAIAAQSGPTVLVGHSFSQRLVILHLLLKVLHDRRVDLCRESVIAGCIAGIEEIG